MSGTTVDAAEYVPVDRWRRLGRIDAIRKRVKRIAIGAGVVFLGLTLVPSRGDLSLLVTAIRLLSLLTGVSAWSVSEALGTATDDEDGDGSALAAVGVLVLVALAWGAERSDAGSILWRLLLGETATAVSDSGVGGMGTDVGTGSADSPVTERNVDGESRPAGTPLGLLLVFLIGGAVILSSWPRAGGFESGGLAVFLLLTAVVGGVVGLFAGLSLQ
ncbi:hypothetical protein [Haloplanus salinarum]|uniref:hypothetical protein n=1 Tax=Haloplanus salinarum TaxID=1912324 RepID=UPI00214C3FD6|nr:hypothetical protein [Haloplanus salinarum]